MAPAQAIRISSVASLADNLSAAVDGFLVFCQSKNLSENSKSLRALLDLA